MTPRAGQGRRTVLTRQSNHTISGITDRHYDCHTYDPEKRHEVQVWDAYLAALIDRPQDESTGSAAGSSSTPWESAADATVAFLRRFPAPDGTYHACKRPRIEDMAVFDAGSLGFSTSPRPSSSPTAGHRSTRDKKYLHL